MHLGLQQLELYFRPLFGTAGGERVSDQRFALLLPLVLAAGSVTAQSADQPVTSEAGAGAALESILREAREQRVARVRPKAAPGAFDLETSQVLDRLRSPGCLICPYAGYSLFSTQSGAFVECSPPVEVGGWTRLRRVA